MLLAIDIGNTNIVVGVFDGEKLKATWRLGTDVHKLEDEYAALLLDLLSMKGLAFADIDDHNLGRRDLGQIGEGRRAVAIAYDGIGEELLQNGRDYAMGLFVTHEGDALGRFCLKRFRIEETVRRAHQFVVSSLVSSLTLSSR